jgi:hypothetical protein
MRDEGSFLGNGNLKLIAEQEKIHKLEKKLKDAERDIWWIQHINATSSNSLSFWAKISLGVL